ncbi:hypothetical protein IZ6_20850 [Terrihabitans soli]|uniref:Uncharacterized protein n=1 Tax=Terrihabitans soli TaxID=708113 RepID=A0A6S6QWE5_9HYPH|nr:hypothetical protein [Terrihabitans soli]BCJ91350.1 hypothetical protein IZ6_20850 [Terrihabitans soli]
MSDVYLIEVGGRAVGLVARDEDGLSYRFHAAVPRAFGLDGRVFKTPDDAQAAARKALGAKPSEAPSQLEDAA